MDSRPIINVIIATENDWMELLRAVPVARRFEWTLDRIRSLEGRPLALGTEQLRIQVYPFQFKKSKGA